MSIWQRIANALAALASGEGLAAVFDRLRAPPERSVAFTIAVIALGAKMAKADGLVTRNEVTAFREVFHIPKEEERNAARVFNLARNDPPATRIMRGGSARCSATGRDRSRTSWRGRLISPWRMASTTRRRMTSCTGSPASSDCRSGSSVIRARFVQDAEPDPWDVLGVEPGAPIEEVRAAWRRLVRETHPDRMLARGVPREAVRLAEKRLVAINRAWEEISSKAD